MPPERAYDAGDVAQHSRPVFHEGLGKRLAELREKHGWSQAQVADMARRRGLPVLTRGVLRYIEEGKTLFPDPDALRAIAKIYEISYEELARSFFEANYGVASQPTERESKRAAQQAAEREAQDDEELWWLRSWRRLSQEGRDAVSRSIRLELGETAVQRPPSRGARQRSAS